MPLRPRFPNNADHAVLNACLLAQAVTICAYIIGVIPDCPAARLAIFSPTIMVAFYAAWRSRT